MHFTCDRNYPHRIRQYDLVYRTPAFDPVQGWPLGSGHLGALDWLEADALVCSVSRCDLWQDGPPGPFRNWKPEEEELSTALKHGGRLVFRFDEPAFDLA